MYYEYYGNTAAVIFCVTGAEAVYGGGKNWEKSLERELQRLATEVYGEECMENINTAGAKAWAYKGALYAYIYMSQCVLERLLLRGELNHKTGKPAISKLEAGEADLGECLSRAYVFIYLL